MAAAVTPVSGHAARALRLYHEPEVLIGFGVSQAWPNEASPPVHPGTHRTIGWVGTEAYTGASLSTLNCFARMQTGVPPYTGATTYQLTALTANTYAIHKTSDNSLVGNASYSSGASANDSVIPGLSLFVTTTAMTAGDTYTFRVDGAQGFKKCDQVLLVIPDAAGALDYRGQRWSSVDPADAVSKGVRHVWVSATFLYGELPLNVTFRQVGVVTQLVRATGVTTSVVALTPSQVADPGLMELVDNRTAVTRSESQREIFEYILELAWGFGLIAATLAASFLPLSGAVA